MPRLYFMAVLIVISTTLSSCGLSRDKAADIIVKELGFPQSEYFLLGEIEIWECMDWLGSSTILAASSARYFVYPCRKTDLANKALSTLEQLGFITYSNEVSRQYDVPLGAGTATVADRYLSVKFTAFGDSIFQNVKPADILADQVDLLRREQRYARKSTDCPEPVFGKVGAALLFRKVFNGVTGIAFSEDNSCAKIEYQWKGEITNSVVLAVTGLVDLPDDLLSPQTETVSMRRYDDGWRIVED